MKYLHIPVLLQETIDGLQIEDNDVVVDMTLGSGGHSEAVLQTNARNLTLIGGDADTDAVSRSELRLMPYHNEQHAIILEVSPNHLIDDVLKRHGINTISKCIFDLGISSDQLEDSGRGFTFQKDEPLLMTMKKESDASEMTAYEIVNSWERDNLADIIYAYGDETFSRQIADAILEARHKTPIKTTFELRDIVAKAIPKKFQSHRIHPATKTFQALRIAVNNELVNLKISLEKIFNLLEPKGRIAVISFHSLEDRIVKHFFREKEDSEEAELYTKKPIAPSEIEIENNPRSRSAKLRILIKS